MSEIKVAAILDNRRLVLNAGKEQGIKLDEKFMIYAAKGKEVKDPDTGESLGELEIAKMPVKVVQVDDRISIAETYRYREINEGGTITGLSQLSGYFAPPKIKREYDTFEIEKSTRKEIDETKSVIKVGDIARRIEENVPD